MFKVSNGQDPYSAIGKYIRDHIMAIEDIIAVIKINEVETNQLFTVDMNEENYFIWENDWWEGEEDVTLIDFFPVSEAQRANQSVQSADTISRQAAIDECNKRGAEHIGYAIAHLPSAQPDSKETSSTHKALDTISRQAAIDAANEWLLDCFNVQKQDRSCGLIRRLEDLPSVQPEQSESEDITFWKKRAREYEEMVLKLTDEMARGTKIDSVLITEEGIVFKKEKSKQRWIPCSERLPAYGEDVLISIGGYCNVGHIVSVNEEEQYNWYFSGWYHLPNDVDAWMPLPEPYREEGETDG